MSDLEACLPADLRGPATTITRIADGLSGAGVHRVERGTRAYVLKIAGADEPLADWHRRLRVLRLAADAGLAPTIVHVDEARRAVLSEFVADRSFPARLGDPRTRDAAIAELGRTIRRVHALPLPADAHARDPRAFLADVRSALGAGFPPPFVAEAVARVLAETPPAGERAPVLSHNDVHPSNLVHDGERLLLLDWDAAGRNDPFYDLATVALFLRMDGDACARLLAAYDDAPVAALPARFAYHRRLVAVLVGSNLLNVARQRGHGGAVGDETRDAAPTLAEFYQRLRAGEVSLATPDGQWAFGLALVKEGAA